MGRVMAPGMSTTIRAQRPRRQRGASDIRRVIWIFGAVAVVSFVGPRSVFAQTAPDKPDQTKSPGTVYAGDDACISCHQAKGETYHRTAHFHTSSLPSKASIHGKFTPGANVLQTTNPKLSYKMEVGEEGFFQKAQYELPTGVREYAKRIDVVVGSGRKGQTFLFWDGDKLLQLPVSYWTELDGWVNSPGYVDGRADFSRIVPPRCLECHGSSFESRAPPENLYNKASLVLGISCEKCHGPGATHIARYRSPSPPRSPAEMAIINPARLSRERQMDICGLCHAGHGNILTPSLSFVPGDVLSRHLEFPKLAPDARPDVHASQIQLLERSRCFESSTTMTCTTCHDVHTPQRDPAAFAPKCMTCHKVESCRTFPKLGRKISGQCITCHMPLQETALIISSANGRSLAPKVRNHQIAIYPDVHLP